jgi:dethiobiotin synthetase
VAHRYDVVIVEGAGGLLSPLGEGFDSRDLMLALKALPVIVAPNRLGSVNQVLLALEALPRPFRNRAQIVLVNPARASLASRTNPALLGEFVPQKAVRVIPWVRS